MTNQGGNDGGDLTPRGFVPLADYLTISRERDALKHQIAELKWALGEDRSEATERIACAVAEKLKVPKTSARFMVRMIRSYPKVALVNDRNADIRVHVWRLRNGFEAATGANIEAIRSHRCFGYILTPDAVEWLKSEAPEVFNQRKGRSA